MLSARFRFEGTSQTSEIGTKEQHKAARLRGLIVRTLWIKIPILLTMLIGLPALGIIISGKEINRYLEFPPKLQFIAKAPFSPAAFALFLFLILIVCIPLLYHSLKAICQAVPQGPQKRFPRWGWVGFGALLICWLVAWNRFDWARMIQEHMFFPLWLSYILVVNALTYRRTATCPLTRSPFRYLLLFPVSAGFWWFFEYLNRFVQNWSYTGTQYGPFKYFLLASLAFSTVLPAVLGTMEFLLSFSWLQKTFHIRIPMLIRRPHLAAKVALLVSALSLALVGVYPDYLFPFLWLSPLVVIVSLKTLGNEPHLFHLHSVTNQRRALAAMIAALVCGFFWELWNYWSLIKWYYDIPFVNDYRLFEMPILGYAGYLPFGLECAVVGGAFVDLSSKREVAGI